MAQKSRGWVFTYNNWTEQSYDYIRRAFEEATKDGIIAYAIIGKEVGDSGTPHLQGYVYFKNERTWKFLKDISKNMHIEKARGSPKENQEYCSKQKNFVEWGSPPEGQGKRTDIDDMKELVKTGADMKECWEYARSYQALKFAEMGIKMFGQKRSWKPIVVWFYGPTGTGKSETAEKLLLSLNLPFWKMGADIGSFPFEGYEGEPGMWLDDFRSSILTFPTLLQVLDRYECRVNVKGSSRQVLAKVIVITCPTKPTETYKLMEEDVNQLLRRITYISGPGNRWEDVRRHLINCPTREKNFENGAEVGGNTIPDPE